MRRLLLILALLLPATFAHVAAQTPRFSFKGLHLGMTKGEADRLIHDTKWDHKGWPGDTSKNVWVLGQEGIPELNEFSTFGCDFMTQRSECAYFDEARVEFENGVAVRLLILGGPVIHDTTITVSRFGRAAETMVRALYGPPTSAFGSFDDLRRGRAYAVWDIPAEGNEPEYTIRITPTRIEVADREYDGRVME